MHPRYPQRNPDPAPMTYHSNTPIVLWANVLGTKKACPPTATYKLSPATPQDLHHQLPELRGG